MVSITTLIFLLIWVFISTIALFTITYYTIVFASPVNQFIDYMENTVEEVLEFGFDTANTSLTSMDNELNNTVIPEMENAISECVDNMMDTLNDGITEITDSAEQFWNTFDNTLNHLITEASKYVKTATKTVEKWSNPSKW